MAIRAGLDREGMAALLRTRRGFEVVGVLATGEQIPALCSRLRPKVLILGVLVPWRRHLIELEAIRKCSPQTAVLVIAPHVADRCVQLGHDDENDGCCRSPLPNETCLLAALACGARGVAYRDITSEELFRSVRALARDEYWIGPGFEVPPPSEFPLSERERAVSLMVGRGSSNKEIGSTLGISEATVKKHVGHSLQKLGLHDRLQLGLCVARHPLHFELD